MEAEDVKILDIDGEAKSFSSTKINMMIVGWVLYLVAILCNIGYYVVHPSQAEFTWRKATIYVLGEKKDLWDILRKGLRYLRICLTCSCCKCCKKQEDINNSKQDQELEKLNNNP